MMENVIPKEIQEEFNDYLREHYNLLNTQLNSGYALMLECDDYQFPIEDKKHLKQLLDEISS